MDLSRSTRGMVLQGYFRIERFRGGGRTVTAVPSTPQDQWAARAPRPDLMIRPGTARAELLPGMGQSRVGMIGGAAQARSSAGVATAPLPAGLPRLIGPGTPLETGIRQAMEGLFDADFSAVRVYHGPAALALGAQAFTLGESLYFAPRLYDPTSRDGVELLGHELTHVVQQRAGRVANPYDHGVAIVQDPVLEAEADRMGRLVAEKLWSGSRVARSAMAHRQGPRNPSPIQLAARRAGWICGCGQQNAHIASRCGRPGCRGTKSAPQQGVPPRRALAAPAAAPVVPAAPLPAPPPAAALVAPAAPPPAPPPAAALVAPAAPPPAPPPAAALVVPAGAPPAPPPAAAPVVPAGAPPGPPAAAAPLVAAGAPPGPAAAAAPVGLAHAPPGPPPATVAALAGGAIRWACVDVPLAAGGVVALPRTLYDLILVYELRAIRPGGGVLVGCPAGLTAASPTINTALNCRLAAGGGACNAADLAAAQAMDTAALKPYLDGLVVGFIAGLPARARARYLAQGTEADWMRGLMREALNHIRTNCTDRTAYERCLKKLASQRAYRRVLWEIAALELQTTPPGGRILYRGASGNHPDCESLGAYDLSCGASMFSGWFADGPTNAGASACPAVYLSKGPKAFYVIRIPAAAAGAAAPAPGSPAALRNAMSYPPIPLDVQLFVWGPGFHPRLRPCGVGGPPHTQFAQVHADVSTLFNAFYTIVAIKFSERGAHPPPPPPAPSLPIFAALTDI